MRFNNYSHSSSFFTTSPISELFRISIAIINFGDDVVSVIATSRSFQRREIGSTLRPRQNGRRFPDDISKRTFLNENVWISIEISPICSQGSN